MTPSEERCAYPDCGLPVGGYPHTCTCPTLRGFGIPHRSAHCHRFMPPSQQGSKPESETAEYDFVCPQGDPFVAIGLAATCPTCGGAGERVGRSDLSDNVPPSEPAVDERAKAHKTMEQVREVVAAMTDVIEVAGDAAGVPRLVRWRDVLAALPESETAAEQQERDSLRLCARSSCLHRRGLHEGLDGGCFVTSCPCGSFLDGMAKAKVCRHEGHPAVGRFRLSAGCVAFPDDREQDLCLHHVMRATPLGTLKLVEDYTIEGLRR